MVSSLSGGNRSLSEELTYITAIFNTNWDFDVPGTSCYCLSPDLFFIPPNISPPFLPISSPLFPSLLGVKELIVLFLALPDSPAPRVTPLLSNYPISI